MIQRANYVFKLIMPWDCCTAEIWTLPDHCKAALQKLSILTIIGSSKYLYYSIDYAIFYNNKANCVLFRYIRVVEVNLFVPNAPFFYPLNTSKNCKVFRCFQGVEKECIGNKCVNEMGVNCKSSLVSVNYFRNILLSDNE